MLEHRLLIWLPVNPYIDTDFDYRALFDRPINNLSTLDHKQDNIIGGKQSINKGHWGKQTKNTGKFERVRRLSIIECIMNGKDCRVQNNCNPYVMSYAVSTKTPALTMMLAVLPY